MRCTVYSFKSLCHRSLILDLVVSNFKLLTTAIGQTAALLPETCDGRECISATLGMMHDVWIVRAPAEGDAIKSLQARFSNGHEFTRIYQIEG